MKGGVSHVPSVVHVDLANVTNAVDANEVAYIDLRVGLLESLARSAFRRCLAELHEPRRNRPKPDSRGDGAGAQQYLVLKRWNNTADDSGVSVVDESTVTAHRALHRIAVGYLEFKSPLCHVVHCDMEGARLPARLCAKMESMTLRVFAAMLLASTTVACVPREVDPNISDLDGDGVVDARDQCMADPEDFDGFEDEDGCAESEGPDHSAAAAETMQPQLKVRTNRIRKGTAKRLSRKSVTAQASKFQGTAWGALVDRNERAAVVFGFGKAWIKAAGKTKNVKVDAYRGSFSPNGKHVALVTAREFLILDARSAKRVRRFPYAPGTEDATETKLIHLGDDGSVLFFDGCELRRGSVRSSSTEAIGPAQCGSRPLVSEDGQRWFTWMQADEKVTVHEIAVQTGKRRAVLGGTGNAPGLSTILISPNGNHLCFSRKKNGSELTCRDLSTLEDLPVWKGATDKRPTFAANGVLGFGAGPLRGERDFFVVNLDKREISKIGSLGAKEEWLSAIGQVGFIASGGNRLRHFDIANGTQLDIALGDGEWEGFAAIPGSTTEFFVGKERRATRDVYRVAVP